MPRWPPPKYRFHLSSADSRTNQAQKVTENGNIYKILKLTRHSIPSWSLALWCPNVNMAKASKTNTPRVNRQYYTPWQRAVTNSKHPHWRIMSMISCIPTSPGQNLISCCREDVLPPPQYYITNISLVVLCCLVSPSTLVARCWFFSSPKHIVSIFFDLNQNILLVI